MKEKILKFNYLRLVIALNLIIWAGFFTAYWSQGYIFKDDGSVWAKSLGTWADGAAHLTYISAMAERTPTSLPVFLGKPFVYPFVADGLSALLVKIGVNIFTAYNLVGIFLSIVLVFGLYWFYRLILKSEILAVVSLNLFLLSGGLGFIKFFQDWYEKGYEVIKAIPQEYTLIEDWKIRWINIVTAELIPQRAFLLAIPLGLIFLWWAWRFCNKQKLWWWHTFSCGLILGVMPLVHAHSYIVFAIVGGWLGVWTVLSNLRHLGHLRKDKKLRHLIALGVLAAAISLPILFLHILPASDRSYIQKWFGWLAKSYKTNWFYWWYMNTGFFLPLAILGWFKARKEMKVFTFGFWLVFAASNIVIFQPYDWDNSKLITWCFLVFSPLVAISLKTFWQRTWVIKIFVPALVFSLVAAGFIDVVRQLQPHLNIPMFDREQLELVNWVKTQTPKEAIFLTGYTHTHPVPTLTGRQILMGYQGWLWSYGIDYSQRERKIKAFYENPNQQLDLLSEYGVDYIVVGPNERMDLFAQPMMFEAIFRPVYKSQNYTVFSAEI